MYRTLLFIVGACLLGCSAAEAAESGVVDLVNRKVLRVCSDPANLPFSNEKHEGFENKIADIIADELKVPVEYYWYPGSMGFEKRTLFAKRCDLIIGTAQGNEDVLNSNAYYRSIYALVTKQGSGLEDVNSLADPRLKDKRIGIIGNSPPGLLMVRYGLMVKAKTYPFMKDARFMDPQADMMKDIRSGEIDAGVLWGPYAGFLAKSAGAPVHVAGLAGDPEVSTKMTYGVSLGVRPSDTDWKKQLNAILLKRRGDIEKVLLDFGVPLLDDQDKLITTPRG